MRTCFRRLAHAGLALMCGGVAPALAATFDIDAWSRARWHAQLITVSEKTRAYYGKDHATVTYKDAWDFDEGDKEGIDEFGPGLQQVRVEAGSLCFTTGQDKNVFFWGDVRRDTPAYGAERIDVACSRARVKNWWGRRRVRMRIKQSLPESDWVFSSGDEPLRKAFQVKGQAWQVVDVPLVADEPIWAVSLETTQPENQIEIDWIRIEAAYPRWYFRKTLSLDEAPRDAALVILCAPAYTLYVNGRRVQEGDNVSARMYETVDCKGIFRKGVNTIAVEVRGTPHYSPRARGLLALEGIVRYHSGRYTRICTDESWRARSVPAAGWYRADFGAAKWPAAVVREPLSQSQLAHQRDQDSWGFFIGPPYFGMIDVALTGRRQPIWDAGETVELTVTVPTPTGWPEVKQTVEYVLIDSLTGKSVGDGRLTRPETKGAFNAFSFRKRLGREGPYFLHFALHDPNGALLDERYYEIVLVGAVKQRKTLGRHPEDGMKLELVDKIDCSNLRDPHEFKEGPYVSGRWVRSQGGKLGSRLTVLANRWRSAVITTKAGGFRATGNTPYSWFGYTFKVKNPGRPHLLVVGYPDDGYRCANVLVVEKHGHRGLCNDLTGKLGQPRTAAAVYTGGRYGTSGKQQRLYQVFWPVTEEAAVIIYKGISTLPAAASNILIYEIKGDLPMLARMGSENRLFGPHFAELGAIPLRYYSGPHGLAFVENLWRMPYLGFLTDWYITIENLVKHLRFLGCNGCVAGVYDGTQPFYPSKSALAVGWNGRVFAPREDMWALLARMFAANEMQVILNLQFQATPRMLSQDVYSDYEVAAMAAPTLRQLSSRGTQSKGRAGGVGGFNAFHPAFSQEMLRVVGELCDRYKGLPGIAGIGQIAGGGWGPHIVAGSGVLAKPSFWGYGDATLKAFESESGIRVPVQSGDPARFGKRMQWLLRNKPLQWSSWRNRKLAALHMAIRDRIAGADSQWRYYLFSHCLPSTVWDDQLAGRQALKDVLKISGMDPALYVNAEKIVFSTMIMNSQATLELEPDEFWALRTVYAGERLLNLYDGTQETGVYPHLDAYKVRTGVAGNWLVDEFRGGGHAAPAGCGFFERFGLALSHRTPVVLPIAWCGADGLSGHVQRTRDVARFYRAIPGGSYRTLHGEGLDVGVSVRFSEAKRGKALYVVNKLWGKANVSLAIRGTSGVHDLVTDDRLPVVSGRLELDMLPYSMRVFALPRGAELIAAGSHSRGAAERVFRRMSSGALVSACADAKGRDKLTRRERNGLAFFEILHAQVDESFRTDDLAGAWAMMDGPVYRRALADMFESVIGHKWDVIGPFPNEAGKGFDAVYQPEQDYMRGVRRAGHKVMGGHVVRWIPKTAEILDGAPGHVDFEKTFEYSDWSVCYAYTRVYSPRSQSAVLAVGSDDDVKVWVNRRLVHEKEGLRPALPGDDKIGVRLQADWNEILVKVADRTGAWEMYCELRQENGEKLWDIRYQPSTRSAGR